TTLDGNGTIEVTENMKFDAIENNFVFEKMNEVFTEVDRPVSDIYEAWEKSKKQNLIYIDNKDVARFSNNVAENGRNTLTIWKMALAYMYTTQGVPIIYQGSEIPMYGPGFPESQLLLQFHS